MHKEIVHIKKTKVFEKYIYIAYDKNHKYQGEIKADDFENNMLKRTVWQSIYLYKENDELALKHFKWALNERKKSAQKQIVKCEDILKGLDKE